MQNTYERVCIKPNDRSYIGKIVCYDDSDCPYKNEDELYWFTVDDITDRWIHVTFLSGKKDLFCITGGNDWLVQEDQFKGEPIIKTIIEDKQQTILEEAQYLTDEDRAKDYGPYYKNAEKAVEIYKAIKGNTEVNTAADVALFQAAHKLGREMCKHKRDNLVDLCGYIKLYYNELMREKE